MIEKGLQLFAEQVAHATRDSPGFQAAKLGYVMVRNKINRIRVNESGIALAYNELVVIATCLDIVMVDTSFMDNDNGHFAIAAELNERIKSSIANTQRARAWR